MLIGSHQHNIIGHQHMAVTIVLLLVTIFVVSLLLNINSYLELYIDQHLTWQLTVL